MGVIEEGVRVAGSVVGEVSEKKKNNNPFPLYDVFHENLRLLTHFLLVTGQFSYFLELMDIANLYETKLIFFFTICERIQLILLMNCICLYFEYLSLMSPK